MDKAYEPHKYEANVYRQWEKTEAFKPSDSPDAEPYTILMPPPNANGDLHLGHTLSTTLQDLMIRYARMKGKSALFVPGADHAGFETQVMFERKLAEENKSRFDFDRDNLYQQIWEFVHANKGNMEDQQRRIGASVDWDRNTFTLDPHVVRTAHQTFKKMWDDDLIYRGKRIVNFCTHHGTAFSDLEVDHKPIDGHLWHIRYPIVDSQDHIVVATTRPETMLGDTGVAVHPDDERYSSLIGKLVELPISGRTVPIVADKGVDPEFGTGAVKLTPAHDSLDFEIAERHNLPAIDIINQKNEININSPENYVGLDALEARDKVVSELEQGGFLVKTEKYSHTVGHCYKCGTIIQPLLMDQWLIRVRPLATQAVRALEENRIEVVPASKKAALIRWYEELRDWNISRQIVWGIPIPAFISDDGEIVIDIDSDQEKIEKDGKVFYKDPDTFDTWFSSGLWPLVTLKYPDSDDFKRYYPTSVMETGADILFWWVSRMVMLGLYLTNEIPFKTVYLHGLITDDETGKKMSKSKGNSLSPTPLHQKYGADALRMGLIASRSAGQNQGFSEKRVETYRNFCNKLWNVSRYILSMVDDYDGNFEAKSAADRWILHKMSSKSRQITESIDSYRFSEALEALYSLLWNDLADWYVEASKVKPNNGVLAYCLDTVLRLAHPFAPFVTESIWSFLPWQSQKLIISDWPDCVISAKNKNQLSESTEFEVIMALVSQIRHISAELQLSKPALYIESGIGAGEWEVVKKLSNLSAVNKGKAEIGIAIASTQVEATLKVEQGIVERYESLLHKRFNKANGYLESLEAKLKNKQFLESAPPELVERTKSRQTEAKELISQLSEQLRAIRK